MRIGWDIDGVGFNFGDSCHRYLESIGEGHLWKSGPTPDPYWDWYKDWGWTTNRFVEFCNAGADAGYIFSGPVRDGYKEAVNAVKELGHTNVFITDRSFGETPEVSENLTRAWFEEHEIEYDELHFSPNKAIVSTDMFIDDKIQNYDDLKAAGTDVYLLNRPWNTMDGPDDRKRIDTIEEYVEAVKHRTLSDSVL